MQYLLEIKATVEQVQSMLEIYGEMIKIAVDIRRNLLAGGGEMHADCEQLLLDHGSEQDDVWGANWYPADQRVEFAALINIRPRLGNRGMIIQDEKIRRDVEFVTRELLGDVR